MVVHKQEIVTGISIIFLYRGTCCAKTINILLPCNVTCLAMTGNIQLIFNLALRSIYKVMPTKTSNSYIFGRTRTGSPALMEIQSSDNENNVLSI